MSVTVHTTVGDLKLELFCQQTPKSCENFLALCGTDYYNNCVFVRNIKSFMVRILVKVATAIGVGNSTMKLLMT